LHLRKEFNLTHEDISEIICTVSPGQMKRNFEPAEVKYTPPNGYAAISSIPYMVSASLVEGRLSLAEVTDEKVKDPRILETAQKVKRAEDLSFIDYRNAAVEIRTKDGRSVKHAQTDAVGSPDIPASREMIESKFRSNAGTCMIAKNMDDIIEMVSNLEQLDDISALMTLLRNTQER
jgi:2-methylcitrate dehydratase PrpD